MSNRLFGRKKGYPIKQEKKKKFDYIFPKLNLNLESVKNKDIFSKFPSTADTFFLEVGFGSGEHVKWQLENNPKTGIFCCEPYINGVANLISSLKEKYYNRIRIMMDDAELLLDTLPEKSISKIFILFPDPWNKKKHFKRRFINEKTISKMSKVMKDDGEIRISTDSSSYVAWILHHFLNSNEFVWEAKSKKDFLCKPLDWVQTRYEKKAISSGKIPIFLIFKKEKNKQ